MAPTDRTACDAVARRAQAAMRPARASGRDHGQGAATRRAARPADALRQRRGRAGMVEAGPRVSIEG